MERADLIVSVSEEKRKHNIQVVQPAREAKMIRRLLARHRGPLPEAAIVRIWRELVGAVSLLQKGLKVSVSSGEGQAYCWDMAKDYFGAILPMVRASAPIASISAVREDDASFAVVPWPQEGENGPWWPFLISQQNDKMRIVCAMPYGVASEGSLNAQGRALVISKTDYAPSGDDRSFIALLVTKKLSRAKIIEVFKKIDLEVLSVVTQNAPGGGEDGQHLVEVTGYVAEGDKRLDTLPQEFDDANAKAIVLGGYPTPPIYKNVEIAPASDAKTETKTEAKSQAKTGT